MNPETLDKFLKKFEEKIKAEKIKAVSDPIYYKEVENLEKAYLEFLNNNKDERILQNHIIIE